MLLFNLFKKPLIIQDYFFGSLLLTKFKDSSNNFLTGEGFFVPTNSKFEYIIVAGVEGPTSEQWEFYKNIQNNFDQYIQKMLPLFEDEFRNWKENFKIKDFNKEFKLDSITIPRLSKKPLIWDLTFTTIHDLNHWVIVDFIDNEPNRVMIDG